MRRDRHVAPPVEPDTDVMTPIEQRLKNRLITLQASVNRVQDQNKMLRILLALFVLVSGIGGYVTFNAADNAKQEVFVNRAQGLGNRELLCIATSAPGNDLPADEVMRLSRLCDRDFVGAR